MLTPSKTRSRSLRSVSPAPESPSVIVAVMVMRLILTILEVFVKLKGLPGTVIWAPSAGIKLPPLSFWGLLLV